MRKRKLQYTCTYQLNNTSVQKIMKEIMYDTPTSAVSSYYESCVVYTMYVCSENQLKLLCSADESQITKPTIREINNFEDFPK